MADNRSGDLVASSRDGDPSATEAVRPICSVASLLDTLSQYELLRSAQVEQLIRELHGRTTEPRTLAKELMQRNWLTPYQVNQLLQGRGSGLRVGSYLLLERLGEGGTGQVFKAKHHLMNRVVALKLIRRELLTDAEVVARFYREIQVISQLDHPNIVRAYDAGLMDALHVLVMEYVDGLDLSRQVKQSGPLRVDQALNNIQQAALGLQYAHERGLVHRDIKPSNLLVEVHGTQPVGMGVVKILDLGLARLHQTRNEQSTAGPSQENSTHTLTPLGGVLMMGTPDYLAPEQALDFHGADIRADIYSLGCTFYYLLTGQPPFAGGTMPQKLVRHQQAEPPPLERFRKDVPPGVVRMLRRMLAKRPEDRFQTPAEVALAASNPEELVPDPAPEPVSLAADTMEVLPRRQRSPYLLPAAGGAAGVVVLLLALLLRSGSPSASGKLANEAPAKMPEPVANSIGMKLVEIPAGDFLMGSPASEAQRQPHEGPLHRINITRSFYLGIHEVTQDQYEKVIGRNPARFKDSPDHPVEQVNWSEAHEFCKRLSALPDEKKAGWRYRLPTEAEWEYACRAGTSTPFCFGTSLSSLQANFNGEAPYGGAEKGPRLGKTMKVGFYKPNAWGLHDMHGNVWEWVADWYDDKYYVKSPIDDPPGSATPGPSRLVRGGCWFEGAASCRSAYRCPLTPSYRIQQVGFRVVGERP